jgi:hypothetical protein
MDLNPETASCMACISQANAHHLFVTALNNYRPKSGTFRNYEPETIRSKILVNSVPKSDLVLAISQSRLAFDLLDYTKEQTDMGRLFLLWGYSNIMLATDSQRRGLLMLERGKNPAKAMELIGESLGYYQSFLEVHATASRRNANLEIMDKYVPFAEMNIAKLVDRAFAYGEKAESKASADIGPVLNALAGN